MTDMPLLPIDIILLQGINMMMMKDYKGQKFIMTHLPLGPPPTTW